MTNAKESNLKEQNEVFKNIFFMRKSFFTVFMSYLNTLGHSYLALDFTATSRPWYSLLHKQSHG